MLAFPRLLVSVYSLLIILSLTACASLETTAPSAISIYTVQRGDTLSLVAQKFGTTFAELVRLNNLISPYSVHSGQVLRVPFPPPEPDIRPLEEPHKKRIRKKKMPLPNSSSSRVPALEKHACAFPVPLHSPTVNGTQIHSSGGVNIFGQAGQTIYAIAAGNVAYSGKGVKGYPNLIILKHNEYFMSIYAHNMNLYVRQGARVQAGQAIAEMGMNAKHQGMLRFELNCRGKRVDPMLFFPH